MSLQTPALAQANDPLVVWQGGATVTSLNKTCRDNLKDLQVGKLASSIFRPRLLAGEPNSTLSLVFKRAAMAFVRQTGDDQMKGAGTYTGPVIRSRARVIPGGAAGNYTFNVKPNVIDETTKFITIVGTLTNVGGVGGCTMKFLGSFALRPN